MAKMYDIAETAKIARREVKRQFPGTKFRIRSHRYSGGTTLIINWQDGVNLDEAKEFVSKFSTQSFDGIDDSTHNKKVLWEGEEAIFPHYLSITRDTSETLTQKVLDYCVQKYPRWDFGGIEITGEGNYCRFGIKDSVDYEEFERATAIAYEELNKSNGDREFDWKNEKATLAQNEEAREQVIAEIKEKDQSYLESVKKPSYPTEYIGNEYEEMRVVAVEIEFVDLNEYSFDDQGNLLHSTYGTISNIPSYDKRPTKPMLRVEKGNTSYQIEVTEWQALIEPITTLEANVVSLDSKRQEKVNECNKADTFLLEQFKTWVKRQIQIDPLKLKEYDYWLKNMVSQADLRAAYKLQLQEQIDGDQLEEVISLEAWAVQKQNSISLLRIE